MADKHLVVALSILAAASPVSAANQDPSHAIGAPTASPDAKYCMRIEAITGSRLEKVRCWTRQQWAEQGVDVDKEWSKEGVAVIA